MADQFTADHRSELDALAECFGVELRAEATAAVDDLDAWAIWCWDPADGTMAEANADIIGTGEALSEAIDAARKQLREWESSP